MQLWMFGAIVGVVFGLVWQEFNQVAKHLNGLKDDYRRLSDEVKELRQRGRCLDAEIRSGLNLIADLARWRDLAYGPEPVLQRANLPRRLA